MGRSLRAGVRTTLSVPRIVPRTARSGAASRNGTRTSPTLGLAGSGIRNVVRRLPTRKPRPAARSVEAADALNRIVTVRVRRAPSPAP